MGHGRPDKYMLSCMASACGITGDAEKAIALFEEFEIDSMGTWCSSAKRENSNHILQILRISDFITHSHHYTLEHYEGRLYYL